MGGRREADSLLPRLPWHQQVEGTVLSLPRDLTTFFPVFLIVDEGAKLEFISNHRKEGNQAGMADPARAGQRNPSTGGSQGGVRAL
jgi:hypothetical protein